MPVDAAPSAFQRWKSVRDSLASTINDYLNTSDELCNTLSSSMHSSFPRSELEQTFSALDLELKSLRLDEVRLKQTRKRISRERNKAHSVVPIHRLPHEILAAIFVVSSNQYIEYGRISALKETGLPATLLAGVCTSWRQLALGTPSIWSHIKIVVSGPSTLKQYEKTALWVERSKNLPLYMEIHDVHYKHRQYMVSGYELSQLTEFLAPLMTRVYALEMRCSTQSTAIPLVMKCWIKSGSTITNKTIQIINNTEEDTAVIGPASEVSAEEFDNFFQSVRGATLRGCHIPELVSFYDGLVELTLWRAEELDEYTQQQLCTMLSATPQLRKLSFVGYYIESSEISPPPVTLARLDSLCIESYSNSSSLAHILPLINITSPSLDLILTLDDEPEVIDAVREFCGRTRVTRLYVKDVIDSSSLRAILCPMVYLETLAIHGFEMPSSMFRDFFNVSRAGGSQAPWSRLRTVYLRHTSVEMCCLQEFAIIHSLTRLYLYDPWIIHGGCEWGITDKECEELEGLMEMVEGFKIYLELDKWAVDDWDFSVLDY